jgi:hypothetical protein
MTFIYFITSIGGLLGLWNNISIYDLQLILMKISTKIINLKVMKKLWMLSNSTKISKLLKWIRIFVIKFNFKVNFFKFLNLKIKIHFSGMAYYRNCYCSHNTNNFIH